MQAIGNNVGRIGDTNQNHVEEVMEAHSQCQFVKPVAILLSTLRMFVASIADPNKKHVERQKDGWGVFGVNAEKVVQRMVEQRELNCASLNKYVF